LTPRTTERKLGILPKPGVVAIVDAPCEWKPGATRRDQGRVERPMNMNPSLSAQLASERQREMLAQASRLRMAARRGPPPWRPGRPSQLSGGPVGCSGAPVRLSPRHEACDDDPLGDTVGGLDAGPGHPPTVLELSE